MSSAFAKPCAVIHSIEGRARPLSVICRRSIYALQSAALVSRTDPCYAQAIGEGRDSGMDARRQRWLQAAAANACVWAVGCSSIGPCPNGTMSNGDACVESSSPRPEDASSRKDASLEAMKADAKSSEPPAAANSGSGAGANAAGSSAGQAMSITAGAAAAAGMTGSAATSGMAGMTAGSNSSGMSVTAGSTAVVAGSGGAASATPGSCGGATCNSKAYCTVNTLGARFCKCLDGGPGNGIARGSCGEECKTPGACGDECAVNNGGCSVSPKAACNKRLGEVATCTCPSGTGGSGLGSRGCVFKLSEQTVLDNSTHLTWQRAATTQKYEWELARQYCSVLMLEGTGWRLPTRQELFVLGNEAFNPAIDLIAFPNTIWGTYWTGEEGFGTAIAISFDANLVRDSSLAKSTLNFVRCVR